jgi:hypothetical protein
MIRLPSSRVLPAGAFKRGARWRDTTCLGRVVEVLGEDGEGVIIETIAGPTRRAVGTITRTSRRRLLKRFDLVVVGA